MKKILEAVVKAGARPAEPGEFTKRAFLNGRIDLSEAEAVMDLIHSKNEFALNSSLKQLRGVLGDKIISIRKQLIHSVAFIESALDDPEHYSMDGFADELKEQILDIMKELKYFLDHADNGRILKEGIQTVIVGKPNAGKSSLLNLLLGEDRAIVTDIAGTTRDALEESIQINGITLNIIDTAGIRETDDLIERMGVDRAKKLLKKADTQISVLIHGKQTIVLMNKSDLEPVVTPQDIKDKGFENIVQISAKEKTGMDALCDKISSMFFRGEVTFNDEIYITNVRHKNAVSNALDSLNLVLNSIEKGMPEDFFSIDLLDAYEQLGFIIGESVSEDLVNEIFSEFCMGK